VSDYTASMIGVLTVLVLSLVLAFLLGCDAPAPEDHRAPDLGPCARPRPEQGSRARVR